MRSRTNVIVWSLGAIIGVIAIGSAVLYFVNSEKMRRYAETQMNRHLKGYAVKIGGARFNPLFFSLRLGDLSLIQEANPQPPVAGVKELKVSLHWSELLRGRLVADLHIERPNIFVNLAAFRAEQASDVPLKEKGWQDAFQAIYPLKISEFRISDGVLTYVDHGEYEPLRFSEIELLATNIRNIRSKRGAYPSPVRVSAKAFEKGTLVFDGSADFLEKPHMSFKGEFSLATMQLGYFAPILRRYNVAVQRGTLSTKGSLEYSPRITDVNVASVDIDGMDANYLHLPQTAGEEKQRVRKAATIVGEYSNEPGTRVRIGGLNIRNSVVGYTDRTADPPYRVFFTNVSGRLDGFSNQLREGPGKLELRGKFVDSGATRVTGTFRPRPNQADLALQIAIEDASMPAMNDIFRSAADVDVKAGRFSLYSELRIRNNRIDGWVKPIFKDMKVEERRDKDGNIFYKAYAGTVKALARVLENRSADQVAARTDISGDIEDPDASLPEIIGTLIGNAWIRAILPGFQSEVNR